MILTLTSDNIKETISVPKGTKFTDEDAKDLKEALRTLFVNDASSARPEGSMEVKELFWFEHGSKLGVTSTAKINELSSMEANDLLIEFDKIKNSADVSNFKPSNQKNEDDIFNITLCTTCTYIFITKI